MATMKAALVITKNSGSSQEHHGEDTIITMAAGIMHSSNKDTEMAIR